MTRSLTVWWEGAVVGSLALDADGQMQFTYAAEWLAADRTGELGIMIGNKGFWNRGYGTQGSAASGGSSEVRAPSRPSAVLAVRACPSSAAGVSWEGSDTSRSA